MADVVNLNGAPRYYNVPKAYRAIIGAAAITSFPGTATTGGVQASGTIVSNGTVPVNGATLVVNGTTITFSTTTGFDAWTVPQVQPLLGANGVPINWQSIADGGYVCKVQATARGTLLNLMALFRCLPDQNLAGVYFTLADLTINVKASATGTAGNSIAMSQAGTSNLTVSATLASGAAPTSGYAVLVEPGLSPVEIQYVFVISHVTQVAGTATIYTSDGVTAKKVSAVTWAAGATLSGTQELSPIPFSFSALNGAGTTLVVNPGEGLYCYGGTTMVATVNAMPGGIYGQ